MKKTKQSGEFKIPECGIYFWCAYFDKNGY